MRTIERPRPLSPKWGLVFFLTISHIDMNHGGTMARGITLTRSIQSIYTSAAGNGYRFTVTASNGTNMPNEIFRYTQQVFDYITNDKQSVFEGICTAEQLASLPIGAPAPTDPNFYFRSTTIDVVCPTRDMANQMWLDIQSDVAILVKALNQQDVLSISETARIGDA